VDVLRQRIADGRVRDGHGDLRVEHVYLSDPVALIDPLEFAPHYRFTDVAAEIGFLAMELQELDRPDLAQSLVERYARTTGDTTLTVVLPFFIRYRAIVRAKVEWIRATQLQGTERETAIARSRTLFHLGATQKLL
jgi:aminoglycoside phosphotransferase family enzyme